MNGAPPEKSPFASGKTATADELERRAHASLADMLRELGAARKSLRTRLNPLWWIRHYPKRTLLVGGGALVLWRLLRGRRNVNAKDGRESVPGGGFGKYLLVKTAQAVGKALPGALFMGLARHGLSRGMRGRGRGGQGD